MQLKRSCEKCQSFFHSFFLHVMWQRLGHAFGVRVDGPSDRGRGWDRDRDRGGCIPVGACAFGAEGHMASIGPNGPRCQGLRKRGASLRSGGGGRRK